MQPALSHWNLCLDEKNGSCSFGGSIPLLKAKLPAQWGLQCTQGFFNAWLWITKGTHWESVAVQALH